MLLLVNPNDEPSLRIANAYVQARHIPVNNILYLSPTTSQGFTQLILSQSAFISTYQSAIPAAIAARGLTNQIDYIGTLGMPHVVNDANGDALCFHDCLNQLTQLQNGMAVNSIAVRPSELDMTPTPISIESYVHGTNAAIHHSTQFTPVGATGTVNTVQWYLSGMVGYSGVNGLTTTQVIQNLLRTVAADGTKPAGTVYFENNDDPRSSSRSPYWPAIEAYMSANDIPWFQEYFSGITATPANRRDVMGAEIGSLDYIVPNGSIYLPGSWADSLTSYGTYYRYEAGQTLADNILLSGAGGSSGTIAEPTSGPGRFPTAAIHIFSNDGSTLGEAFYSTVDTPDMIMFQGDLLSQAYADVPTVSFTSAPANGATVSGTVTLSGSAFLPNLTAQSTATGIAALNLFVDGINTGATVSAASGSFNLDTTTMTDGMHEVRLVAYNNSAAASEGCAILNLAVSNHGESVSVTGTNSYNISANQTLTIPVTATQGTGPAITGIQLQSLGRVVGSVSGLSGNVSVSGTALAYGSNSLAPVALLSGSKQVQGMPITVTRRFQPQQGTPSTPLANRNPGFDVFFYPGAAQKTMAATSFSGAPAYTRHINTLALLGTKMPSAYSTTAGGSNKGLAVMIKGSFTVTTPGEYSFCFLGMNTSGQSSAWTSCNISIDGVTEEGYDAWSGSSVSLVNVAADTGRSVYLLPGEHTLTVKLANVPSSGASTADSSMNCFILFRGVDSNVRYTSGASPGFNIANTSGYAAGPFFYTVKK